MFHPGKRNLKNRAFLLDAHVWGVKDASNMNLTSVIRRLESQLKVAGKLARQYSARASSLQLKLAKVAKAIGQPVAATAAAPARRKRRKISAQGLANIVAAQRKRWAGHTTKKVKGAPGKRTGKMSAAGRRAIAEAQRKRWAAYRKAKGK